MDYELKEKVVMVTGAGSGIGHDVAIMAARQGARIIVADMNADAAIRTKDEITADGGQATSVVVDVTDGPAIDAALDGLPEGYRTLDGLVTCAGVSIPASATDMSDEQWNATIDINLTGTFLSCQAAGRRMIDSGGGSIVTIGSTGSFSGYERATAYCASKHGVHGVTQVLALEWGRHGVRVNCVAPGPIDTGMLRRNQPADFVNGVLIDRTPVNRLGRGDDIAHAVLFLLSPVTTYMNGALMPVDGGLSTGHMNRWNGRDLASKRLLDEGAYEIPGEAVL